MITFKEFLKENKEFTTEDGEVIYGWRSVKDLCDEEGDGYIPKGYKKILELGGIYASEPGKGQGDRLMKKFLSTPEAMKAELIFLDPVPGLGKNFKSEKPDEEQIEDLKRFYKRYGFRHNPKSHRMWLVQKGELSDTELPT